MNKIIGDIELQKNVQAALLWEPLLTNTEIGISVQNGIITLTGIVDTYAKKIKAEDTAKNILGVRAVAETIEVRYSDELHKTDTEIAKEALQAFTWSWQVPHEAIKIKVEGGCVTLEGDVTWLYEKDAAKELLMNLPGVKSVQNRINIISPAQEKIETEAIEQALQRSVLTGDQEIHVKVSGNTITLTGKVNSLFQKGEAERITRNTPGIKSITNQLFVGYDD